MFADILIPDRLHFNTYRRLVSLTLRAAILVILAAPTAPTALAQPVAFFTPLDNQTGKPEHDATAEALTDVVQIFTAQAGIRIVERELFHRVLAEHELTLRDLTNHAHAIELGQIMHADRLVVGTMIKSPRDAPDAPTLHVTLQVWHLPDERLLGTATHQAPLDAMPELARELADQLHQPLGTTPPEQRTPADADHPLAQLHYLRGLGYHHADHHDRALMAFFHATDLDPEHDRAALYRIHAYRALDELDHAAVAAHAFLQDHPQSPRVDAARKLLEEHRDHLPDTFLREPAAEQDPE